MAAKMMVGIVTYLVLPGLIAYAACTVRDDAGNIIKLNHHATRIISLAPDITETLFAIGAGEKVVAVMSGSDYPAKALQIPRIGSYASLDLEKIIALKPDLIITWDHLFVRDLQILKNMGISVYVNKPERLDDVARSMRLFGCLAGTEKVANKVAHEFLTKLTALTQHDAHSKPVTVFYQIGPYSLMTVNKQSWINQAIDLCGGRNVFANAPSIATEVSLEAVLTSQPQIIIAASTDQDWQRRWQRYPSMIAVQNHLLFTVPPDWINRAGPRLLAGVAKICSFIDLSRSKFGYLAGNS